MRPKRRSNQLRIIAGAWRGRRLAFVPMPGLRPTPDRIRETLFNWLSPVIREARCLDLFAGSGALGLEAASRGASEVVLVDSDPQVIQTLQTQVRQLQARQVRVVHAGSAHYLHGPARPFDIVFLDPPFRAGLLPDCLQQLESAGWLTAKAWVYIEVEHGLQLQIPEHWELYRSKTAGQVDYHLATRCVAPGAP
jgi:16S rRNA (guanine966-N2)-methyltransferase